MCQIHIYSDSVHSGKTSKLEQWVKKQSAVDGILAPVVNGERYLKRITSGERKLLEITTGAVNAAKVEIGRYTFSREIFKWGQNQLLDCLKNPLDWLIIDEIGPLELMGKGLEPVVSKVLSEMPLSLNTRILIVVREFLKNKVIQHYNLGSGNFKTFTFED